MKYLTQNLFLASVKNKVYKIIKIEKPYKIFLHFANF